jgi:hypothetical protein
VAFARPTDVALALTTPLTVNVSPGLVGDAQAAMTDRMPATAILGR